MNTVPQRKGFINRLKNFRRGVGTRFAAGAQRVSNAAGSVRKATGMGLMAAGRGISEVAASARNAASRGLGLARQNANTATKLAGISAKLNVVLSRLNKINASLAQGAINSAVRANIKAGEAVTISNQKPTPNNVRNASLAVKKAETLTSAANERVNTVSQV